MSSPPTYTTQAAWSKIMTFLPEALHLSEAQLPKESVWWWKGHEVHVETCGDREKSPVVLICLHGVGTNGRQMSLLTGYGVTKVAKNSKVTYADWVDLVCDYVKEEAKKTPSKPIVLYGLSAGGMLAYHVAARCEEVKGIVGMTFLDQREKEVRDTTAHDIVVARLGVPFASLVKNTPFGGMKMPMKLTSKMWALVNNKKALKVFLGDGSSAGNWVSTRFLAAYMTYVPAVEPEGFEGCPILLTQPAEDRWTPLRLSELFLKRLSKVSTKVVMLEKAGHYPLEQPGIDQLHAAIHAFITETVLK